MRTTRDDADVAALLSEAADEIERLHDARKRRGIEELLADVNGKPVTYEALEALLDAALAHARELEALLDAARE